MCQREIAEIDREREVWMRAFEDRINLAEAIEWADRLDLDKTPGYTLEEALRELGLPDPEARHR